MTARTEAHKGIEEVEALIENYVIHDITKALPVSSRR
jgi:hypothetical protein